MSKHLHAVEPVKPVRDFDLARYSFVESVDEVADLDSRADLTTMTAMKFEHFVRQLFEARGLQGWTTERSGDDGTRDVLRRDPEERSVLALQHRPPFRSQTTSAAGSSPPRAAATTRAIAAAEVDAGYAVAIATQDEAARAAALDAVQARLRADSGNLVWAASDANAAVASTVGGVQDARPNTTAWARFNKAVLV